MSRLKNRIKK